MSIPTVDSSETSSLELFYDTLTDAATGVLKADNQSTLTTTATSSDFYYDISYICRPELDRIKHCIILFVFTLIGLIGNLTLLCVIVFSKHLHSAPNILIVNLILGDLLYIFSTAPFNIRHEIIACWLLGPTMCKMKHYLPMVAQAACIFSLVALSRDRYNAIVRGLESRIKRRFVDNPVFTVSMSWLLGCVVSAPVLYFTETRLQDLFPGGLLCQYMPMKDIEVKVYMMLVFGILYVIPLFVIAFHYVQLARSLVRTGIATLVPNRNCARQMRSRKRLALIVITITVFFGVFWLPYYVYHIWYIFTRHGLLIKANAHRVQVFRHFYNYMSLANSCLNPWIVFFMSSAHRQCIGTCICGNRYARWILASKIPALRVRSTSLHTSSSSWKTNDPSNSQSAPAVYPATVFSDQAC